MQWLAALSVRRPVFATVIILSLTVIGAFAFTRLGVDRFPKVDFPTVIVTTRLPGAAPEEIETEITDKIEEGVNTISGIDELRSNSSEGVSQVIIAFLLEKDADIAAQEVRDRVNRVLPLLPKTIQQPTVEKFDPDSAPVLTLAVSANKPVRDITEYADKTLRRQLESVSGVGQVVVLGGRARQVNITLDADRLRAYSLTVNDVSRALQNQNAEIPGGRVEQGATAMTLRTRGRVHSVAEFGDIVVRQTEGHPVLLRDVATIEDGMAEALTQANVNGEPAVLLTVRRQSGTNTVQVVDAVKERLAEVAPLAPAGYQIRVVRDLSEFIKASIDSVEEHLVVGSILAAAVVLVFLWNWRSTIIAAIAIPTSIIATFGLIWYQGFTLNSMTMLALTLAVGIVIDDAIVVLENIYRFVEEKGRPPMQAAVEATREIGLAVLATTLSLVAIFVPVGFMGGIVGRFMTSFGFTMSFAIMVSLLVSFTLTPMLSARWIRMKPRREGAPREDHESKDARFFRPLDRGYAAMLSWSLAHRGIVAGIAVLVLFSSVPLFMLANKNFLPNDDQSEFEVGLRAPEGTSLDATEIIANRIASRIRKLPEVDYTLVTVADDPAQTQNLGTVYVRLKPVNKRAARPVRGDEPGPKRRAAADRRQETPDRRAAGRDHRRRRQPERRDSVHHQRAGSQLLEKYRQCRWRRGEEGAGRRRRGHVAERRQAGALGAARPVEGRRPGRADRRRGRSAAPAGWRRSGDNLQRRRRAVRSARARHGGRPPDGGGDRAADGAVEPSRRRRAREPGEADAGHGSVGDQPAEPAAAGDGVRWPASGVSQTPAMDAMTRAADSLEHGPGLQHALRGPLARARPRGAELPARVRAVAGVHVPDSRGAVRVVAPSDHDSAVAAADAAVRAAVDHHHPAVAQHLLGARAAGAVRRRQEELDSADRPRQSAARARHGARRGRAPGEPGPVAARF